MSRFASYDGTEIEFRVLGQGRPLLCLPGGPGRASEYLGDLGGLARSWQLILPDTRGTGASADADPATYRCDRLVADVEALRAHLGLERFDLLGHSGGANLAVLYAAAFPERPDHLVLLTPGLSALGVEISDEEIRAALERRSDEPWYPEAMAAVEKAEAGDDSLENRNTCVPFCYGRWDEAARAHAQVGISERARAVRDGFFADGAFDPGATRAALGRLAAPVLVYAGGLDFTPTPDGAVRAGRLFPRSDVVVQPGAGHFPWLDDPAWFTAALNSFLG
ncbi:MAG TPA: alpha/beta hydrolase [Streptosporangiaceae bacterium]|nr:alpha/beta hydrolase [Streptosporangiaceae bacterium]